jgi:energy-coupling factor transport system substrate-specific component
MSKFPPIFSEKMMQKQPRKLFLAAMMTALGVTLGYLFLTVPNVELVTATVFISGFILGPATGVVVGAVTELIFSALNPMGMPMPNLLIAQIFGMALVGFVGGFLRKREWYKKSVVKQAIIFALAGFLVTLVFDVLTTFSFSIVMAEGDMRKILSSFIFGMSFYAIHLVVNTALFATFVPLVISRLKVVIYD